MLQLCLLCYPLMVLNSIEQNTKLNLVLIYRHAHYNESFEINAASMQNAIYIYDKTVVYVTLFQIYYYSCI